MVLLFTGSDVTWSQLHLSNLQLEDAHISPFSTAAFAMQPNSTLRLHDITIDVSCTTVVLYEQWACALQPEIALQVCTVCYYDILGFDVSCIECTVLMSKHESATV